MSDLSNDLSNKKQRLGRGLGSLLGQAQERTQLPSFEKKQDNQKSNEDVLRTGPQSPAQHVPTEARIWNLGIEKLQPGVYQPRTHFEKEKIEELAQSIKQNGILQPIVVRKIDNSKFEIIAGERRWRAAQAAGLKEVPVIIKTLKNQQALELSIIENVQREDLNPLEEAEAYSKLANEFNLTQAEIAEKVGKDRATVANSLRLLNLSSVAREYLVQNKLTQGHAKVLLSETDHEKQSKIAKKIVEENWTVRELENQLKKRDKESAEATNSAVSLDGQVTQRLIKGLSDELQKIMGTKVSIDYKNSKGKVIVNFYSDEELTQIVDRIKLGCQK
jgi:ParB family chromosome partitioning protein